MDLYVSIFIWVIKFTVIFLSGFAVLFPYDFWRIIMGGKGKKKPFFLYLIFLRVMGLIIFITALIFFFMG